MTLEELWELFPIVLVGHNPSWKEWADSETASLSVLLARFSPTCSHIGSTAIPAIKAKPIIDILVEVPTTVNWDNIRTTLEN
ncbi:GrpB family protein, partial [uncultured Duncaniella sp.]